MRFGSFSSRWIIWTQLSSFGHWSMIHVVPKIWMMDRKLHSPDWNAMIGIPIDLSGTRKWRPTGLVIYCGNEGEKETVNEIMDRIDKDILNDAWGLDLPPKWRSYLQRSLHDKNVHRTRGERLNLIWGFDEQITGDGTTSTTEMGRSDNSRVPETMDKTK